MNDENDLLENIAEREAVGATFVLLAHTRICCYRSVSAKFGHCRESAPN